MALEMVFKKMQLAYLQTRVECVCNKYACLLEKCFMQNMDRALITKWKDRQTDRQTARYAYILYMCTIHFLLRPHICFAN